VGVIEIPPTSGANELLIACVAVIGSVLAEISFDGEGLLADRAVIWWLAASPACHRW